MIIKIEIPDESLVMPRLLEQATAAGLDVVTWVFLAAVAEATRPPGLIETKVVYKDPAGYAPGPN